MTRERRDLPSDPVLWGRIRGAHLPTERDGRDFHEHLAEITGVSVHAARVLEREYRRFLYVAAHTDGARVPSVAVRRAWDYHRDLDAEGYFEEFCPFVLGHAVEPGAGGPALYAETLDDYRAEFGETPPEDYWPKP